MSTLRKGKALHYSGGQLEEYDCEVIIDNFTITISYDEMDIRGPVVYKGFEMGEGHYRLNCPSRNGTASLHRFQNDKDKLEGAWVEDGYKGMWEITLR